MLGNEASMSPTPETIYGRDPDQEIWDKKDVRRLRDIGAEFAVNVDVAAKAGEIYDTDRGPGKVPAGKVLVRIYAGEHGDLKAFWEKVKS